MNEDLGLQPQMDQADQQMDKVLSEATNQFKQPIVMPKKSSVQLDAIKETLLNYIVPLVSILLTVLIGLFVLYPSYKSLPDLQTQLDQKRLLKSNLEKKIDNLNRLADFKNVVDEDAALVSKVLVSDQLIPGLLTQVDKITQEAGLSINRLNYGVGVTTQAGGTATPVTYNYVTVNLGVTGSFEQIKTFLSRLEGAARIIDVDKFRYTLSETDAGNFLGVNFVLVSPYLFVESTAITDESINLDISSPAFVGLINKIKNLNYYDPNEINLEVPVIEATEEDKEEELTGEEIIQQVTQQEVLQGAGEPTQ